MFIRLIALLLSLTTSVAQAVTLADRAAVRSQVERDSSGFLACGVSATVIVNNVEAVVFYDFSVMLRTKMPVGTLKAGSHTGQLAEIARVKKLPPARMPAPKNFWIAVATESQPLWPKMIMKAESPGYLLAVGDLLLSLKVITAMALGERVQFAVRYASEDRDDVISFASPVDPAEMESLTACLGSVIQQLPEE